MPSYKLVYLSNKNQHLLVVQDDYCNASIFWDNFDWSALPLEQTIILNEELENNEYKVLIQEEYASVFWKIINRDRGAVKLLPESLQKCITKTCFQQASSDLRRVIPSPDSIKSPTLVGELVGKTIKQATKKYPDSEGPELLLEMEDGSEFIVSIEGYVTIYEEISAAITVRKVLVKGAFINEMSDDFE